MGTTEILLAAAVVLIPLAIAVAVTLWTLEPAARRAERAKRVRRTTRSGPMVPSQHPEAAEDGTRTDESAS